MWSCVCRPCNGLLTAKQASLKLKTRQKLLLGYLPLAFALAQATIWRDGVKSRIRFPLTPTNFRSVSTWPTLPACWYHAKRNFSGKYVHRNGERISCFTLTPIWMSHISLMSAKKLSAWNRKVGGFPTRGIFTKPFTNFFRSLFEYWRLITKVNRPCMLTLYRLGTPLIRINTAINFVNTAPGNYSHHSIFS
jgi:hypothetical protein